MSTELVRLRYTGGHAVTFQHPGVGQVEPGGEFDVGPESLLSFMRRADIEHAGECPEPPCRCGLEPESEASEDASASQDGETSGGKPSGKRGGSGSSGRKDDAETGVP